MATAPDRTKYLTNDYPTSDGKPMAETDWHRELMLDLIEELKFWYAARRRVYVSGNLFLFYVRNDRRRHLSPDVFVVKGVPKRTRPNYLLWEEGKAPDVVIELTSSSTRREDVETKFRLYQDTLRVREYFLFDPLGDYLDPQMRGYRLRKGVYAPIRPVNSRLPSQVLGLHLEAAGQALRLYDPATEAWLPTPAERAEQAESAREEAEVARERAETAQRAERAARERAEAEVERLREELEALRRQAGEKS
jgi:Uma2 family endonuclease